MAKSKKKILTPEALKLVASRFKLLADPMRLTILNQLEGGELSVNEIAEAVEASQPNVSKHLKILQEAGLLHRRQEGNTVFYSIADESVFQLCEVVCGSLQQHLTAQASIFSATRTAPKV